jgi:hypothetical protein
MKVVDAVVYCPGHQRHVVRAVCVALQSVVVGDVGFLVAVLLRKE